VQSRVEQIKQKIAGQRPAALVGGRVDGGSVAEERPRDGSENRKTVSKFDSLATIQGDQGPML
jgi:hypothetical protein